MKLKGFICFLTEAYSKVFRLTSDNGIPFRVYLNPSKTVIDNIFKSDPKITSLRIGKDKLSDDEYYWNAYLDTHSGVADKLGYKDSGKELSLDREAWEDGEY